VVDLAEQVASTDIEEGMRVGVDRNKYQVCSACPEENYNVLKVINICF